MLKLCHWNGRHKKYERTEIFWCWNFPRTICNEEFQGFFLFPLDEGKICGVSEKIKGDWNVLCNINEILKSSFNNPPELLNLHSKESGITFSHAWYFERILNFTLFVNNWYGSYVSVGSESHPHISEIFHYAGAYIENIHKASSNISAQDPISFALFFTDVKKRALYMNPSSLAGTRKGGYGEELQIDFLVRLAKIVTPIDLLLKSFEWKILCSMRVKAWNKICLVKGDMKMFCALF